MLYKNKYRIESTRLKEFDYSSPYWYYVIINTKDHREYFGGVDKSKIILNQLGEIVDEEWRNITVIRSGVD